MTPPRNLRRLCAPAFLTTLLVGAVDAQVLEIPTQSDAEQSQEASDTPEDVRRPRMSLREVIRFGFDERGDLPVPAYWRSAQDAPPMRSRPGFPSWNLPRQDFSKSYAGAGSVVLPTRGGSAAIRTRGGAAPILSGSDFGCTVMVHTQGLKHARAGFVLRLLDESQQRIPNAEATSDYITSEETWTPLRAQLPGAWPEAAYLEIELQVLQPAHAPDAPRTDDPAFWLEDFEGAAWFDDVRVVQLPRVELRAESAVASSVYDADTPIELRSNIRDLTGESLIGSLTLHDARGRLIHTEQRTLRRDLAEELWRAAAPSPGWYRATLEITSGTSTLSRRSVDLIIEPSAESRVYAAGFGVEIARTPVHRIEELAAAMERWPLERLVMIGVGTPTDRKLEMSQGDALINLTTAFMDRAQRLEYVFPSEATGQNEIETDRRIALDEASGAWDSTYAPLLERLSARTKVWGVGVRRSPAQNASADVLDDPILEQLGVYVPRPILRTPWHFWLGPPARRAGIRHAVHAPSEVSETAARSFAENAQASTGSIEFVFTPSPLEEGGPLEQVGSLVRATTRLVGAFESAGLARPPLTLRDAVTWGERSFEGASVAPALGAWFELARVFEGRRVVGTIDLLGGRVTCVILQSEEQTARSDAIIAWSNTGDDETVNFRFAPSSVTSRTFFGVEETLELSSTHSRALTHELIVRPEGVIVENADAGLILLERSLVVTPDRLAADARETDMTLSWINPWDVTIEGTYAIMDPPQQTSSNPGWDISPRSGRFRIEPGATFEAPLRVAFSSLLENDRQPIGVELDLTNEHSLGPIEIVGEVGVGSGSFDVEVAALRVPDITSDELTIEVTVSNMIDDPIDVAITVHLGMGEPPRESLVGALGDDKAAVRVFRVPLSADEMRGRSIAVTVQDQLTGERVNRIFEIP